MRFQTSGKITRSILLVKAFLLSCVIHSCAYSSKSARKLLSASEGTVYDVIVVPGVPLENGKWSRTMQGRVYWAKYLYDRGITKNIMFSGSAVYTPYYEAIIMALYAVAIGIPEENVFHETRSEHSTENIYYSYLKAKEMGFNRIALASDPFQTKLLRGFVRRRLNREVALLPMVKDTMKMLSPQMTDPEIAIEKAFDKNFISIRKREGFFKRLRGTMGYNIKKVSR